MSFLDLPVEVGVTIINYLDTPTKINFYNSCAQVREYFGSGWCRLKNVVLSRSTLATVKSLNQKLFVNLGEHITDLNLSGIQDLSVANLKPHMNRFVNLKSLDLTFTNINLTDLEQVCPQSVTNIGINFFKHSSNNGNESDKIKCRQTFRNQKFEVVHFVVFEFVDSASPLLFLSGVPLIKDLKLTIANNNRGIFDFELDPVDFSAPTDIKTNFNKLTFIFRDCHTMHWSKQMNGVSMLNFNEIEYIFIMYLEKFIIYVSPIFSNIFVGNHNLKVEVSSYLPQNFMLDGNIVFRAWNKATTTFDDVFFSHLLLELKDYFPTYVCMHNKTEMRIVKSPSSWYCVDSWENFETWNGLPEKITLTDFCRQNGKIIRCRQPISLSKNFKMLQHLTLLRINNIPVRMEFFTNLFNVCPKLITLDVYIEKRGGMIEGYTQSLSKAIHLAKLKNFMLTSEDIDYGVIFEILSRCVSLENVHICDHNWTDNDEDINTDNIVVFIEKCVNLYSLFIEVNMTEEGLTMLMAPLRITAQTLERDHLCIEVRETDCGWNTFKDVFNPSPLHIVN